MYINRDGTIVPDKKITSGSVSQFSWRNPYVWKIMDKLFNIHKDEYIEAIEITEQGITALFKRKD